MCVVDGIWRDDETSGFGLVGKTVFGQCISIIYKRHFKRFNISCEYYQFLRQQTTAHPSTCSPSYSFDLLIFFLHCPHSVAMEASLLSSFRHLAGLQVLERPEWMGHYERPEVRCADV
jgi:hypothetical protein